MALAGEPRVTDRTLRLEEARIRIAAALGTLNHLDDVPSQEFAVRLLEKAIEYLRPE